ncbi:hypothetical protein N2152v2_010541 [Parachlorella kessleri]
MPKRSPSTDSEERSPKRKRDDDDDREDRGRRRSGGRRGDDSDSRDKRDRSPSASSDSGRSSDTSSSDGSEKDSPERSRKEHEHSRGRGRSPSPADKAGKRWRSSSRERARDGDEERDRDSRRERGRERDGRYSSRGYEGGRGDRWQGGGGEDRWNDRREEDRRGEGRRRGGGEERRDDRRGERRDDRWDGRRDERQRRGGDEPRDEERREQRRGGGRGRGEETDRGRGKAEEETGAKPAQNGTAAGEAGGAPGASADAAPAVPRQRKELAAGPAGGVYIPPFKLAAMLAEVSGGAAGASRDELVCLGRMMSWRGEQAQRGQGYVEVMVEDRESAAYQRLTWDALRKSINGLINKVNTVNIKNILPEFFNENLIRGRGLFCRSLMKSQLASPAFTPVYAALVAVINTKLPEIGELLLHRVVTQFKRAYKRNDKPICIAALTVIAHLTNQQVVAEGLALEIMLLLLENPSDDSVEVAAQFVQEVGALLEDIAPQGLNAIFDRMRGILSEGQVPQRTGFIIQNLMAVRKQGFAKDHPAVPPELDLVETSDQITHELSLDDPLETKMYLDVFKEDPDFKQHEAEYAAIRKEILGEEEEEESEEEEGKKGGGDDSEEEEEDSEEEEEGGQAAGQGGITDLTSTNLVNLRRTIYLTIMSALDFEEAGHKLLKMGIPEGHEMELCTMIIECCSNEKTFVKYYGLLAERFSKLNRRYSELFCECFVRQYQLIHRLETNKLRNCARLFGHLLATDAVPWSVLSVIRLTEEDTTSSSRIFIKILFQELAESLGLLALNKRLDDPDGAEWFGGLFPRDSPRHMRFAINFFTSIGLGGLTDRMRDMLRKLQQLAAQQAAAAAAAGSESESESESDTTSSSSLESDTSSSDSDSDDSSSDSSSSDSDSSSESESESEDERDKRRSSKGGRASKPPSTSDRGGRGSAGPEQLPQAAAGDGGGRGEPNGSGREAPREAREGRGPPEGDPGGRGGRAERGSYREQPRERAGRGYDDDRRGRGYDSREGGDRRGERDAGGRRRGREEYDERRGRRGDEGSDRRERGRGDSDRRGGREEDGERRERRR